MDDTMDDKELISALADGRLEGDAFARAMALVQSQRGALEDWHTYHLIGDVLRSRELAGGIPPARFLERLSARLAQEGTRPQVDTLPPIAVRSAQPAANDGTFRWKMVAGVASVGAFAAIGWSVLSGAPAGAPAQPQLAAAPAAESPLASAIQQPPASAGGPVLARNEPGVMIRDPKLDELLAAHRQFGGASALQMPAGFLRNATFEGPAR